MHFRKYINYGMSPENMIICKISKIAIIKQI